MEENNESMSSQVEANAMLAFESIKDELAAVPDDALVHINVDINAAVTQVLGAVRKLKVYRERVKLLPEFDLPQFDKLEVYARAASWSNVLYTVASRPVESMPELADEATKLRDLLYSDAVALAHRGLLRSDDLRSIKTAVGYRPLVNDLGALMALLTANWDRVKAKSAIDEVDLKRAQDLYNRIFNAISQREQGPTSALVEASLTRQRAYTLLFRAYDNARRAVTFLQWKDDVETIVPSLFAGRNLGRRRSEEDATETGVQPVAPLPDVSLPVSEPILPAGIVPSVAPASATPAATLSPIPVGFPGADPYIRNN